MFGFLKRKPRVKIAWHDFDLGMLPEEKEFYFQFGGPQRSQAELGEDRRVSIYFSNILRGWVVEFENVNGRGCSPLALYRTIDAAKIAAEILLHEVETRDSAEALAKLEAS